MKKTIQRLLLCGLTAGLMHTADAEVKMAFVDLQRTFDDYHRTQDADAKLKELADEFNADREEMVTELEAMREAFNTVRADALDQALSEDVREKKRTEAEERLMEIRAQEEKIQRFDRLRAKQIEEQGRRMRKGIVEEIQKLIRDHARLNGYTMVLDVSGETLNGIESVLYYDVKYDITDDIIEKMNAEHLGVEN